MQLCTYNRRALLGKVMQALFAQDLDASDYEIVLVDDGSTDGTYEEVIADLRPSCALTVVRQRNAGLAAGRNAGIARARGELIMFMDDDVLATPELLAAHIRCHRAHARAICRGGVINVESFDELPRARYTWRNYSGAYFWTTNVSVPLALLKDAGGFDERFREYGWEDLDVGLRLRHLGVPSFLARDALVFHYKPAPQPSAFSGMARQARAQARTALQFIEKHPHWRVALATGQLEPLVWWSGVASALGWPRMLERLAGREDGNVPIGVRRWAAARFARAEYYRELRSARSRARGG
ncbi:MAG: glycosyltransferase family 2 protein [Candidatus Eremiobacteraeota bacterium]|nr:glycosyltransferase family 2 protein [Candidatus Eremiobacteraeota bacterium]MBV8222327.1 glycosyltransferase family 2 protein [Candidatus Eremiobacteraeota bacterium]